MADYLKLTSRQNGSTVALNKQGNPLATFETRINGGEWTNYDYGSVITLPNGHYVEFKNSNNGASAGGATVYCFFTMTGKVEASGDITTIYATEGTATPANQYAFAKLFQNCEALVKAPDCSRITHLQNYMFLLTFENTGISEIPAFNPNLAMASATTRYTFQSAFYGCNNLKKAVLPFVGGSVTGPNTFFYAFSDCKNLEEFDFGEHNPSTNRFGCTNMFEGCTKLKKITLNWTNWWLNSSGDYCTNQWLRGVDTVGEFHCPDELVEKIPSRDENGVPTKWAINPVPETGMRLKFNDKKVKTLYINGKSVSSLYINGKLAYSGGEEEITGAVAFTSLQDDSTIKIIKEGSPDPVALEYKIDGDWKPYVIGTSINVINGWTIYFRNTTGTFSGDDENYHSILAYGRWNVAGEINALLDYRTQAATVPMYAFANLFNNFWSAGGPANIVDASRLKISFESAGTGSFSSMFYQVASLEKAPKILDLGAIGESACYGMFQECTSLTAAPELPCTELGPNCYFNMFRGCTRLTDAPVLPAADLRTSCYRAMFAYTGLLQPPALPATNLQGFCYQEMFYSCTNLVAAPELPATTLAPHCYNGMFQKCTSLTTAPELPATVLAANCYNNMFLQSGVTNVPLLPATTLAQSCYQSMFEGCTGLSSVSSIANPSMLATQCMQRMFANCTNLSFVSDTLFSAETLATSCYKEMFRDCVSLVTGPRLPATTLVASCYQLMFYGCSKLNEVKVGFTQWPTGLLSTATQNWMYNVASTGTLHCKSALADPSARGGSTILAGWTIVRDVA